MTVAATAISLDDTAIRDRVDAQPLGRTPHSIFFADATAKLEEIWRVPAREGFHFAVLAGNAPWFKPGNSGPVLASMIDRRMLAQTPFEVHALSTPAHAGASGRELATVNLAVWEPLVTSFIAAIRAVDCVREFRAQPIIFEEVLPAWIAHLPPHNVKKLIAEGVRIDTAVDAATSYSSPLNRKHNEKLFKRDAQNILDPVCRGINAVSPTNIYRTGPECYEVYQRMKRLFSVERCLAGEYITYCSAATGACPVRIAFVQGPITDVDMARVVTYAASAALNGVHVCLIAGDDLLGLVRAGGSAWSFEGDYSKYDQSQISGPITAQLAIYAYLGMSRACYTTLGQINKGNAVVGSRALGLRWAFNYAIPGGMMRRQTGGNDTTAGGSIDNMIAVAEVLSRLGGVRLWAAIPAEVSDRLAAEFLSLGFKIKLKVQTDSAHSHAFVGTTFLKHIVLRAEYHPRTLPEEPLYHATGDEVFIVCPLESRLCKIGVTLVDPRKIYSGRGFDARTCYLAYLNDQAAGFADAWLPIGPLWEFCARFKTCPKILSDPEDAYRLAHSKEPFLGVDKYDWRPLDAPAVYRRRYGEEYDDAPALGRLIQTCPVPGFLEHPLFERFARMDYA